MKLFKSRGFYTTLVVFVYFGLVGVTHTLPNFPGADAIIGVLGFLLINYFHLNPSQSYGNSVLTK